MKEKDFAVQINNLHKIYKVFDSPNQRLMSLLFKRKLGKDFKALDDVSLEIKKGEAYAIVGKNGSGKSTMLQILAGIIKPTRGEIAVNGKVAALLELGSGFDPESTGYENIYMNAAIYGLDREEIEQKIKDIIEFADIGEHLYQPVKTYSSGMYVRLGFAVAISVDADILLVDEALAVGDVFFRQKCYSRLNELKEKGVTIILVTHNMSEVEQFCDRASLLDGGKLLITGSSQEVVKNYYLLQSTNEKLKNVLKKEKNKICGGHENLDREVIFPSKWSFNMNELHSIAETEQIGTMNAQILGIGLFDSDGNLSNYFVQGEEAHFVAAVKFHKDIEVPIASVIIKDEHNKILHGKDITQYDINLPVLIKKGRILYVHQIIKMDIAQGEYTYEVGIGNLKRVAYEKRALLEQEEIDLNMERLCAKGEAGCFSVFHKKIGAPTRMAFHGCCDLQGGAEVSFETRDME